MLLIRGHNTKKTHIMGNHDTYLKGPTNVFHIRMVYLNPLIIGGFVSICHSFFINTIIFTKICK